MFVKPLQINVIEKNQKQNLSFDENNKVTNFRREEKNDLEIRNKNLTIWQRFQLKFLRFFCLSKRKPEPKDESNLKTQLELFQSSMKYCFVSGQCLGLFPIISITGRDVQNVKYKMFSWKYLLCYIILLAEVLAAVLTSFRLIYVNFSLSTIKVSIYFTICFITNILFVRLSTKWDHLLDLVATSELDEYIDSSMKFKCNFVTVAIMSFSFVEHAIQKTFKILMVYNCRWSDINLHSYQQYLRATYTYAFDLNLPYSIGFGILIQILSLIASFIWSYSHVFIICISFYLTSILELLNKKIISCEGKDLPPSHWRALREDYNRATLLIRSFDDVINSIMFIVTANDLFFVCCQLYYLIGEVIIGSTSRSCPNSSWGFLIGYELIVYLIISVIFYTTRFFSVLLIAAKIHTASLVVTPSLYNVATSSYCCEVQRFIEKINGDTVALTGLNFFYTTRDLILSVIGTIVTYELVLLQFQRDQIT